MRVILASLCSPPAEPPGEVMPALIICLQISAEPRERALKFWKVTQIWNGCYYCGNNPEPWGLGPETRSSAHSTFSYSRLGTGCVSCFRSSKIMWDFFFFFWFLKVTLGVMVICQLSWGRISTGLRPAVSVSLKFMLRRQSPSRGNPIMK